MAAQPAFHQDGSAMEPPLIESDVQALGGNAADVKSISRPEVLKENVKTFFDESKGKVDQGLSRIFTTFSIYGTLCTFCFAFFYSSKLFENKNCCIPSVSWSPDRNECCTKLLTDVQPSCCNSPRLGDQLTHCQISPEGGFKSLACKRRGQPVSVLINTDFFNESSLRGLMPEVAARRAAMNLLGNCTTGANIQTYQQLLVAITFALVSVGSALLTFAASQGQAVAIAVRELAIYRAYLQGENIKSLQQIFMDTTISARAKKRRRQYLQWTWRFYSQLLVNALTEAPLSLISLFVLLLTIAMVGATWSACAECFCKMRLPHAGSVIRTVPLPFLGVISISVAQTIWGVQREFTRFRKLQEGLLDLAQKSEDDIAKKTDKEAVAKDIAWSLRVLANRPMEGIGNDGLLGSPPPT